MIIIIDSNDYDMVTQLFNDLDIFFKLPSQESSYYETFESKMNSEEFRATESKHQNLELDKIEKSGISKLNRRDVLKIRKLYAKGNLSQNHISAMFGVSQDTISSITLRKTWKNV